ncbi:MAG: rod shape-determining protein MreC, partial [Candidatus Daviesbacteria bacterium]
KQMGELLVENSTLRKKLSETENLVESYNKLNPLTFDLLPARVLGISRYLNIDRGSSDNLSVGEVVVYKDSYVGQIKSVGPKISQVLLSEDPDSKIAVFSQGNERRSRGIVTGQFGSELLMDKILHQETVEVGDLVYAEGTEGKLPKGLIIGKIIQIFEQPNQVFKQAKVEPIFKITDLDTVFVIKN